MLVDAGADLLAKDALGLTPLDLADKADHTETMAVLRGAVDRQEQEKQRDFYSLLGACASGDLASVKAILRAKSHLSDNKLQTAPFAMWSCTSLRELNLYLNMLSDSSHMCRRLSLRVES